MHLKILPVGFFHAFLLSAKRKCNQAHPTPSFSASFLFLDWKEKRMASTLFNTLNIKFFTLISFKVAVEIHIRIHIVKTVLSLDFGLII